jgi:hypothetical protein
MASLEDLLRQTQASYEFYLDNPEDEFNYDYTEPMMQPMMQPMEQTMIQPLTQDISIPNYIMPDMYEEDDEGTTYNLPLDVSRKGTTLSNFNPLNSYQNLNPYTKVGVNFAANALIPGSGTLFGLANLANDYYNPPRDPYGGLIDFNKQPDYDFGPDGDGVAFGGNEVTAKDAIDTGFGNVRGPDEDVSLKEKMEYEGTDGGGEPGGGYDSESETDSGSGTHSDPGD